MLLEINQARDTLRVVGEDNDEIIRELLTGVSAYLEVTTGRDWSKDSEPHPLAQTAAKFILQLWYHPQDENADRIKRVIDSLLVSLTVIGRGMDG